MLKLEKLDISINELSGLVPYCIYNMSSLTFLSIGNNSFAGKLPWKIGLLLPSISTLILQANRFEGPIPASLVNASSLEVPDLGVNSFHGLVPKLGTLTMLKDLDIGANHLEGQDWISLSSLTNCSSLVKLLLDDNKFKGSIPESVGNFTINMNWLWLSNNNFSGRIPSTIGNLKNLTLLYADQNQLTGSIPSTIWQSTKTGFSKLGKK
jgi:LRR receptor-like serine/threonine-protein kinase FLS2